MASKKKTCGWCAGEGTVSKEKVRGVPGEYVHVTCKRCKGTGVI